jgi:hypothetical protein
VNNEEHTFIVNDQNHPQIETFTELEIVEIMHDVQRKTLKRCLMI